MSRGSDIASKVRAGLAKATAATGDAVAMEIIRRGAATGPAYAPTYGADTVHPCVGVRTWRAVIQPDGTRVDGAKLVLMVASDGLSITPTTDDRVNLGGIMHSIDAVSALAPGGVVLMWKMDVSA